MTDDSEGSGRDLIEVSSGICEAGLRKTNKHHCQDSLCPGRDLNRENAVKESRPYRLVI